MVEARVSFEAVCLKSETYVFGGLDKSNCWVKSIKKYSPSTDIWDVVAEKPEYRYVFCASAIVDRIQVLGGVTDDTVDSCLRFDAEYYSWSEVARINVGRELAARAVFEEKLVVSGGCDINGNVLNTVKSFC